MKNTTYLPVDPDFIEILEIETSKKQNLKVFYFEDEEEVGEAKGEFERISKKEAAEFLELQNAEPVRLDRIISINGKPGPAYEEYDNYANACLTCMAGYEDDGR